MDTTPTVFVGSSKEAGETARLVGKSLSDVAYVKWWWDTKEFTGSVGTLEALLKAAKRHDFAVFLLTPDDKIESRGKKLYTTRDNVLFEAGLFLGALGPERVQVLVQTGNDPKKQVKIPSDLAGVNAPRYHSHNPDAAEATINNALSDFRNQIKTLGKIQEPWNVIKGFDFNPARREFHMTLSAALLEKSAQRIGGKAFLLVARKDDPNIDPTDDVHITLSKIRRLPTAGRDLVISVVLPPETNILPDDIIEGYLLGVQDGFKVGKCKTMGDLLRAGAESIQGKGKRAGVSP